MPMEVAQFLHAKNVNPVRVHNVAMAVEWTKALAEQQNGGMGKSRAWKRGCGYSCVYPSRRQWLLVLFTITNKSVSTCDDEVWYHKYLIG
jgi:hypothetical protein